MDLQLSHKTVLVTGSGHGIGRGLVRTFLEEGSNAVVADVNEAMLTQTVTELTKEYESSRLLSFCGDLTKTSAMESCVNSTFERFGSLDVLVCNIGSGRSKMGLSATLDDWRSMFEINLFSSVEAVRVCAPKMQRGCVIIFIASIAGVQALKAPYAYSAAKAGILSLTKNLSDDLGDRGIRVNAIAPGNVLFPGSTWEKKMAEDPKGTSEYIEDNVPLKMFADTSDIGAAAAFLASPKARFITGTCLTVDGGQVRSV